MKITKTQLKQIIKEEIERLQRTSGSPLAKARPGSDDHAEFTATLPLRDKISKRGEGIVWAYQAWSSNPTRDKEEKFLALKQDWEDTLAVHAKDLENPKPDQLGVEEALEKWLPAVEEVLQQYAELSAEKERRRPKRW